MLFGGQFVHLNMGTKLISNPDFYTCGGSENSFLHYCLGRFVVHFIFSLSDKKLLQFFDLYEKLLTSPNYVTRRQSLKVGYCYATF